MNSRTSRTDRGMTLVEIIIALAVVAIALLGAVSLVSLSMSTDSTAKERMMAMDQAKTIMEQIRETDFDDIFDTWHKLGFDVEGLEPKDGDQDGSPGFVTIDNSDADLLDIEVLVEWKGMAGETNLSFVTKLGRQ